MKKTLCILLTALMLLTMMPFGVQAVETDSHVEYIYEEDGSYLKVTITEVLSRAHTTITASKRYERFNADDVLLWDAVLAGSFSYDGTIAICNYATIDVTTYKSAYALNSKSVGKRSNYAYCTFSINTLLTGVVVATNTYEMTLTCDKNGNLS